MKKLLIPLSVFIASLAYADPPITVRSVMSPVPATVASGGVASGAMSSGSYASGALASGAISDGADVTLGAKADAKSTATDTTPTTIMQVLKEISAMVQAPPSQAVTNAGTFAVQAAITAASASIASGAIASGAIASGAIASGAIASGAVASGAYASGALASGSVSDGAVVTLGAKADAKSTATDTTAVTIMQVLKEISAMVQAPPSQAVTNTGTFATQSAVTAASGSYSSGALASGSIASGAIASGAIASGAIASGALASGSVSDGAVVTLGAKADAKSTATDTTAITLMQVAKEISFMLQNPAALPSNQSVNVAQINAVTPLMGNGATGTGSHRVTVSNDNTGIANWGHGATGSAVPTGATYMGTIGSGNLKGLIQADNSVKLDMSTATTTELVALVSAKLIYVTHWDVIAGGTGNIKLVYGTGTNCGTGTTDLTGNYNLVAQAGISSGAGLGPVAIVPAGKALCATTSANVQMSGIVAYTQF